MKILNQELLFNLTELAKTNARLRMNFNLHNSLDAKAQRLLNALEPGTILPIHRHLHTNETCIILRGKLKVLIYNENAQLIESIILDPQSENLGVDLTAGQWHTIEVLETGTIIFEVKDGPYSPLTDEDILKF